MKGVIVVSAFFLVFGLMTTVSSNKKSIIGTGNGHSGNVHELKIASESVQREDFPYANHLDPKTYLDTYNKIQNMPSEAKRATFEGKGRRSVNISQTEWESYGPLGVPWKDDPTGNQAFGRIRTMLWYYNSGTNSWERYLGAGSGGLYYSQQVFTSVIWQSLGDNLPNPSVGAIAVDPTNNNVIFVGTGDWGRDHGAGIFKTTNRGQTWSSIPLSVYPYWITKIAYLVGNSIMIASTSGGIVRSTDGGTTWSLKAVEPTDSTSPCFDLVVVNPSRLYAALPWQGVYTSNDGGNSWSKVSSGLPTNHGTTLAIDVSQSDPNTLYAAYTDSNNNQGGIYKSTNGGASWSRTADPPTYIDLGQGHHTNVIRVHPSDPNTVYAASVGFVKSTDGGASWTTPDGWHSDHTVIEFDPGDPNTMYLCSDGGIIIHNDATNTNFNSNFEFLPGAPLQVYEMDYCWSKSGEMIGGTQDNGEIFTTGGSNSGDPWLQIGGCDGGNQISIDPSNPSNIFGNDWCGAVSPRWRSLSQGDSADNIDNGLTTGTYIPIRLAKGGPEILFTCDTLGLYNSYNQGNNWLASTPNLGHDFSGPYPWTPQLSVNNYATFANKVCYVVWNGDNYVFQGAPGAMSETKLLETFDHLIADRGDPNEVFGTTATGIYKSMDRGYSWTPISGSYPNQIPAGASINDVLEIVSGGAIYAATTMGVFKSNDGGQNWFSFQNGLPVVSVVRIFAIPGPTYDTLRIATYGRGFWQRLINDINPNLLAPKPLNGIVLGLTGNKYGVHGVGYLGKIINSSDGGNSWDTSSSGTSNNLNAVCTIGDQTIIAAGDTQTVVRSTDAGSTWTLIPPRARGNITGVCSTPNGTSWMCMDNGNILTSIDTGRSWLSQSSFPGIVFHACQFMDDSTGAILGHTTVGGTVPIVYFTTNRGGQWNPTYPTTMNDLNKLFFTSDSDGFVVGDGGTILKTTDQGNSWTLLSSGVTTPLHDCFFKDPLTGYACGDSGTFIMTQDGGSTWSRMPNSGTSNLRALTMVNANLIIGGDGTIMSSSQAHQNTILYNLSNSWNLVSLPVTAMDNSIGTLFPSKSSDAFSYNGSGYATSPTMIPGEGYWLRFSGQQVAQVTGAPIETLQIPVTTGWNLIGSTNTSLNVQNITSFPAGIVTSQFFGYNTGYIVSSTIEPGKAYWVKTNQPGTLIFTPSSSVNPMLAGRIRIVPTNDRPPAPPGMGTVTQAPQPNAFALGQNYPNPFNPMTTLRYELPRDAIVTIKVFDILGREVVTLVDRQEKAGIRSVTWNASSFASGIYFYRMEAEALDKSERYSESHKMLLIK